MKVGVKYCGGCQSACVDTKHLIAIKTIFALKNKEEFDEIKNCLRRF